MQNKTVSDKYFSSKQLIGQAYESTKRSVKAKPGDDIVVYVRDDEGEEIATYLATFCRTVEDIVVIAVGDAGVEEYERGIVVNDVMDFGDEAQGIAEPLYVVETRCRA